MGAYEFFQLILDNIAVPILIAIGGGLVIIANKWFDKIHKNMEVKSEIDNISKRMKARKDILETLEPAVKAAVASNMEIANTLKENKGRLTEEDIVHLNESAKELVLNTLPKSLTDEDGVLLDIIGGKSQLDAAIKVMIERHVYEYKQEAAKNNIKNNKGIQYPMTPTISKKFY